MNKKQKICLWVGIAVIVFMGFIPPWVYTKISYAVGQAGNAGYHCILYPPEPRVVSLREGIRIDILRLLVQWAIVSVITGGLIVTFKDKKRKDEKDNK
ncbi:MAG: hypothetical protein ACYS32_13685 [Planctomycetota bacterium]|jgi:hypothetical protein